MDAGAAAAQSPIRTLQAFSKTVSHHRGDGRTGLTPQKLQLGGTGLTPLKHGGLEMSPGRAFASTGLTPVNLNVPRTRKGGSKGKKGKRRSSYGMPPAGELSPTKEDWQPNASFTPLKNDEWNTGFTPLKETTDWGSLSLSPFNTPNFAKGKQTTPRSRDLPGRQFWAGLPSPMRPSDGKRQANGQGSQAKKAIRLEGPPNTSTSWPSPSRHPLPI